MKTIFTTSFLLLSILAFSQVGINTGNPHAIFNVDGAKDNPSTGIPNAAQQANDFVVTSSGNVGIGTVTPAYNLEANGSVAFPDVKDKVINSTYNALAIDSSTGEIGTYTQGAQPTLYRATKATRNTESFTSGKYIQAPINTGTTTGADPQLVTLINTIGATFGTDTNNYEYVQFNQNGLYRIELLGYVHLSSGNATTGAYIHVVLNHYNGSIWSEIDNQRLAVEYLFSGTAKPLRQLVYIGNFNSGDRVAFAMTSQNPTTGITGGWTKPVSNKFGTQLIISKL